MVSLVRNWLIMVGMVKQEEINFRNRDKWKTKDQLDFLTWYKSLEVKKDGPPCMGLCNPFLSEDKVERKSIEGVVTSLFDDNGLIDHQVYFKIKDVVGFGTNDRPDVGDKVMVECFRRGKGGWRATRVTLMKEEIDWDKVDFRIPSTHEERGMMIGLISNLDFKNKSGQIEDSVNFEFKDISFEPCIGDWVQAEVQPGNTATSIKPTLTKLITGVVTHAPWPNRGCYSGNINNEIFFELNSCSKNYSPRKFDQVAATIIESKQGRSNWRALKVDLINRGNITRDTPTKSNQSGWVLRGERPEFKGRCASLPSFLPKYAVDESLRNCIEENKDLLAIRPVLKKPLCFNNYASRFSALLHLEELAMEKEIESYKLRNVTLKSRGQFLVLQVPGVYDGKPSLFIGDVVILHTSVPNGAKQHGFIHHIAMETEELLLKFHDRFQAHFDEEETFDASFSYSRTPFRRSHLAVNLAKQYFAENILFSDPHGKIQTKKKQFQLLPDTNNKADLFTNKLLNDRQRLAVKRILEGEARPKPFILFGPPGTGKTVTLVEAIIQVLSNIESTRLLICAPSNSAVDLLCQRLHDSGKIGPKQMTRFNAFRRPIQAISEELQQYCHPEESLMVTSHYRLILTTCVNAGNFHTLKLPLNHFSHVFVDEAGQASEPECLIPLSLATRGQIVLTGDPEQLGPVLKSSFAQYYGLNISFIERLMDLDEYQRNTKLYEHGYNPILVTKLVNNYRSHPSLLTLPSRLFYHNELIACASENISHVLCDWEQLPTQNFPLIFHGIVGKQLREEGCPSWFNASEVIQVTRYTKLLMHDKLVSTNEIGVITPYRKQVEKIRMMFKALHVEGVKVGSVEEFQGQERKVIIISTVRTNDHQGVTESNHHQEKVESRDVRSLLGFVASSKRFNVAITRSQALLVVVGNPFVLIEDKHWRSLLKYSIKNKAYVGVNIKSIEDKLNQ